MSEQDDRDNASAGEERGNTGDIKPPTREGEEQVEREPNTREDDGDIKPPTE